jgi:flavin reductase (DIM6/NTAB) family NADH-FMN oxidoreductase RutF
MEQMRSDAQWKSISPYELENTCKLIGKDWMLVCAGDNAMTASWGGMGILWNKPVSFVFIRPQRYTYQMTEANDRLTLAFFDESYRDALRYFGTKSGRDGDKFAATGLTRAYTESGTLYPAEARLVLTCRKLYTDMLRKEAFLDPALLGNYPADDFHRMYVCEIEEAWIKA